MKPSKGRVLGAIFCLDLLCVGLASAAIAPFDFPPLAGILLIGQTIFFMMFLLGIARLTPLDADHPSYQDGAPAATIIARMEQTRRRLLAVDIVTGAISLLVGVILLVLFEMSVPGITQWRLLLLIASMIALPLGVALIGHSFTLLPRRSAYEYARLAGEPATAIVLKVTKTAGKRPSRTFDPAKFYILELQVMPATGAPYCVTVSQLLRKHSSN
ncbi:MAG TPA: hypothetical protein VEC93_18980, partial [Anaerolineae bacterium]|nr:hypothetical protein [Anaerolineae bacterium]